MMCDEGIRVSRCPPSPRLWRASAGRVTRNACMRLFVASFVANFVAPSSSLAEQFAIDIPSYGTVYVDVSHVGPGGDLVRPGAPVVPKFGPPAIFSAPLPSGSGARALGLAGAFTAVADDATAASWNPGGLTQLERPEASAVIRHSHEENRHHSDSEAFRVGKNDFGNTGLNYFSLVQPFHLWRRNWVFSLNYQEAYDFSQQFSADLMGASDGVNEQTLTETYRETTVDPIVGTSTMGGGVVVTTAEINVTSYLTTRKTSFLSQILASDMVTSLDFEQEGVINAISPALAIDLTPKIALGTVLNFYNDMTVECRPVRAKTVARYTGSSHGHSDILTRQTTDGTYTYDGTIYWSRLLPFLEDEDIDATSGEYAPFTDTSSSERNDVVVFDGIYEEENEYECFWGINATFGMLCVLNRYFSLGATIDLPWTAEAKQTRNIRNTITTYNEARTQVLDVSETSRRESKDVEFTFPLYCALGVLWRCSNRLYTSLDISHTTWSMFSYKAEGERRTNPLDGTPHGENDVDDCWAARLGVEYLWVLRWTEIPFRAGASWEQRPAVGDPDEYLGCSLGSGISLGRDPGKLIIDFAYMHTWADDVLGSLVPGQNMSTDLVRNDFFVSGIWHF